MSVESHSRVTRSFSYVVPESRSSLGDSFPYRGCRQFTRVWSRPAAEPGPNGQAPQCEAGDKKSLQGWLEKDVTYVITDGSEGLSRDSDRRRARKVYRGFWRRRDPDPDTEENEFKEEYYERIAYANEHFASGIPGWKSDRGRIWIMYGKPDERETHPMGGSYDRPSYHGGGSTSTYPFEIWFYRYLAGVGSGVEIEFVDPTAAVSIALRESDEKDAMLMIPERPNALGQLGLTANGSHRRHRGSNSYQREQIVLSLA